MSALLDVDMASLGKKLLADAYLAEMHLVAREAGCSLVSALQFMHEAGILRESNAKPLMSAFVKLTNEGSSAITPKPAVTLNPNPSSCPQTTTFRQATSW